MRHNIKLYLIFITLISAMGGLLFGYDWVVIGGAKPFYELYFNIQNSPLMQGFVMGSAILGCLLGVMTSGSLADRQGRKPLLILSAAIFVAAALGTGLSNQIHWFIFYRVLGGTGIGIASNISPMYIAEVSPAKIRGKFVSINQLTIVIGILSAQVVNWLIADPVSEGDNILNSWNGQMGWRWMFWCGGVPAIIFFVLAFFVPESPRWLCTRMQFEKSQRILARIIGSECAIKEIETIKTMLAHKKEEINYKLFFKSRMSKILLIGVVIAVFQQWCGINVIFNYAQEVFAAAGYGVSDILFNIVITGVTNVIFTLVGMYLVDKLGRKPLLLFGASGLACVYVLLGICYFFQSSGIAVLVLIILAIAIYAMTLAPVTWVVISEIFPTRIRGMAVGISTFSLWTACFILTYTFPLLNKELGAYGTFWMYGLICILGFVFVKKILSETKGKTLEEIEEDLTR